MTEGPESRSALLSYSLEVLFSNTLASFFHDADTIRMLNNMLIPAVDRYVGHVKNKFALETLHLDENSQQDYKDLVEILFNKKEGRFFDLTDEHFSRIPIAYLMHSGFQTLFRASSVK